MITSTWVASMIVFGLLASASAEPVDDLKLVGQGKMRWMLWEVYQARLYSPTGKYQPDDYPLALSIKYSRGIEKKALIKTTVDEWERLDIHWKPDWKKSLETIWPSVAKGDILAFRVESTGRSRFYFNGKPIGEMKDPEFAKAFLAIWLDPETRAPELRRELMSLE